MRRFLTCVKKNRFFEESEKETKSYLVDQLGKVGLKLYSEIYQNFRILEKVLGHRVRHQK